LLRELLGDGETRRARTNDGHATVRGLRHYGRRDASVPALVVRDERLQLADGHRRLLAVWGGTDGEADDAGALAEQFLGAEAPAHIREVAGLAEL